MITSGKVQANVKVSLSTTRSIGGEEEQLHSFLALAVDGGKLLTLLSDRFTSGKEPRYPLHKRLFGPQNRSGHF